MNNILIDTCFWYALYDESDDKYRKNALENTFFTNEKRPMSLVDMTIRFMLEDVNLNLNTLITFNRGDFFDLCYSKGIELISE